MIRLLLVAVLLLLPSFTSAAFSCGCRCYHFGDCPSSCPCQPSDGSFSCGPFDPSASPCPTPPPPPPPSPTPSPPGPGPSPPGPSPPGPSPPGPSPPGPSPPGPSPPSPPAPTPAPTTSANGTEQLKALYQATNGGNWRNNDNWLTGDPCLNEWHGITCVNGAVVQIDLGNNSLAGTLPAKLFVYFPSLQLVNLNDNDLTGPVPSLEGLTQLKFFYLNSREGKAGMTGVMDDNIWKQTQLTELSLEGNPQLSGTISDSIGEMRNLHLLSLRNTKFSGTLPDSFWNIASPGSLEETVEAIQTKPCGCPCLSFTDCPSSCSCSPGPSGFTCGGTAPSSGCPTLAPRTPTPTDPHPPFTPPPHPGPPTPPAPPAPPAPPQLPGLHIINFERTDLAGSIGPGVANFKGLRIIQIPKYDGASGPTFTGELPSAFWSIPALEIVDFTNCGFTGTVDPAINQASQFAKLFLTGNKLSGPFPDMHPNAFTTNASVVKIEQNAFTSVPPQFFNRGVQLLQATGNQLTGTIPENIKDAQQLEYVYLDHNTLGGPIPDGVCGLKGLRKLMLSNNYFTDLPPCLGEGNEAMEVLEIDHNALGGTLPIKTMCKMTKLNTLQMQVNGYLGGTLDDCIGGLTNLVSLTIDDTSISGTIPESLSSIAPLENLILSMSQFSGTIPDIFHSLPHLHTVTIQSRHIGDLVVDPCLQGPIPPSLMRHPGIRSLSLQFNKLNGTIPDTIDQMTSLWQLMLNNNELEGTIPSSLLKHLATKLEGTDERIVMLNHNFLTGTLPESADKFENVSQFVINNNYLSGYIPPLYNSTYEWLNTKDPASQSRYQYFLYNLRLLPPVPDWAAKMGAGPVWAQLNGDVAVLGRKDAIVNIAASDVVSLGVSWCPFPTDHTTGKPGVVAMFCSEDSAKCGTPQAGVSFWHSIPVSAVVRSATPGQHDIITHLNFTIPPTLRSTATLGPRSVYLAYNGNDYTGAGSNVIPIANGPMPQVILYDPHPLLVSSSPAGGRKWGCVDVTVKGKNFVDTGSDELLCVFRSTTGETFNVSAAYLNATDLVCHIPDFSQHNAPSPGSNYTITITPDGGASYSKDNTTALSFVFHDECPVSPAIPSLPFGNNCDSGCNLCPCTSAGDCVLNSTTHSLQCNCLPSFEGANCERCKKLYWGIDCLPCPNCAPHGHCDDSKTGGGKCICDMWWAGKTCDFYYKNIVIVSIVVGVVLMVAIPLYIKRGRIRAWYRDYKNKTELTPLVDINKEGEDDHDEEAE